MIKANFLKFSIQDKTKTMGPVLGSAQNMDNIHSSVWYSHNRDTIHYKLKQYLLCDAHLAFRGSTPPVREHNTEIKLKNRLVYSSSNSSSVLNNHTCLCLIILSLWHKYTWFLALENDEAS